MTILYDQFHRPVAFPDRAGPDTREISVATLRDRWSTYPSSGLTPERLARIFRQADGGDVLRQAELFEEMEEKDAHLASQFQVRKLAVQRLGWEVAPADQTGRAEETTGFCREALESLPDWDEHILDLLDALSKGYSMMETSLSIMTFFEWGLSRYSYFHQTFTSSIKVQLQ